MFTRKIYKHKDNVAAQLNAGITASSSSLVLKSGNGAQFPTTYGGTTTSIGSSTVLNCTGIGASGVAVGDIVENVTDGSYGVVKVVNTDSLYTTRLKGGTSNTWGNAQKWAINRFIVTLISYDTDGVTVLKREKVLIDSRSSDTLTVNASGRGYDSSTAQSFSADDYVYLLWTSAATDGIGQALAQLAQDVDGLVSQGSGEVYAADGGGTDAYAITLVPAITAYAIGQVFNFKANTINTGNATLNVNGLGAKNILKNNDQTLEDGDIEAGQIVTVVYDGTQFQMQSQIANVFASKANVQKGEMIYAADGGANDSYSITLSPAPAAYTTGMVIHFKANTANTGAATLNVNSLGAKTIKKSYNSDLEDNDIKANQLVSVIYDGTNFQLLSPVSNLAGTLISSASGSTNDGATAIPSGTRTILVKFFKSHSGDATTGQADLGGQVTLDNQGGCTTSTVNMVTSGTSGGGSSPKFLLGRATISGTDVLTKTFTQANSGTETQDSGFTVTIYFYR